MNKTLLSLAAAALCCATTFAQDYEPTTMWPYVNPEFETGQITFADSTRAEAKVNVHLLAGELQQLSGDDVKTVSGRVARASIGKDTYVNVDGCMCLVLGDTAGVMVVKQVLCDQNKLMSGTGAYGATLSTSGRQELTSIEMGGHNITNHGLMHQNRSQSRALPLKTARKVVYAGKVVDASPRYIRQLLIPEARRDEWNAKVKAAKIRWAKDESVGQVAALLADFLK